MNPLKTMKKSYKQIGNKIVIFSSIMLGSLLALPALADEKSKPFKVEGSLGTQYDSNITVEELDVATSKSDMALLLSADVDYKRALSKKINLNTGYSFSQSLHEDLDQFDRRTHLLSASITYGFDSKTSAGMSFNYADSALDGDGFMSLTRISPFASHYISKKIFIRPALALTDKRFDGQDNRDVDALSMNVDLYYFIDGPKNYLITGYKYTKENADSSAFDYDGHQLKLRWIKRLNLMNMQNKLRLGWRFETRDYDDISSAGGQIRDDTRHRLSADLEIPLQKQTSILLEYEYRNYQSNLDSADFNEHLATVRVQNRIF
ncbi:MAG: surface lipoprotein assembly modifier [Chromatiales bacterium]|nr:surface lipoprotein assembly modifier [Chromatiales bacterium]